MPKLIDPDDLIGRAEFAELGGASHSAVVNNWETRAAERGESFPEPVARLRCGPIWTRQDAADWLHSTGRGSR